MVDLTQLFENAESKIIIAYCICISLIHAPSKDFSAWHLKVVYSHHLKTGQSGIQNVIFRTQFVSGFQMLKSAILSLTIRKPGRFLDHST
jgi:hypothetical protein